MERQYHQLQCPTLAKTGPCNCTPIVVADPTPSDIVVWMNEEQRKAERWMRRDSGVFCFTLTGPELMRIRLALEGK